MSNAISWTEFSKKQLQSIKFADSWINIYEGAVRSGKTVASIIAWLAFLEASPHTEFLISGKTERTAYRNLIGGAIGIINMIGADRAVFRQGAEGGSQLGIKFPDKDGNLATKIVYVVGANDEKSESKIRGMTIGGWYADEITLHPESFTKQAINRMSLAGAQAFWTTNPDSPYHYVKTEFIDKANERNYRVFHFELDDNKSLDNRYKENLKQSYSGLWYKRMVLGLWVMADGVIYDLFNHETMVVSKRQLPHMTHYYIGVDYGNSNATVFLLIGAGTDGRAYILDEYYHSGAGSEERSKAPSVYAQEFVQWAYKPRPWIPGGESVNVKKIFIDPSAKGFILELYRIMNPSERRKIQAAVNDVLLGIETVSNVIDRDLLRVLNTCKHTLKEKSTYSWDPTAQRQGKDKPIKSNDHAMDAERYVFMATARKWLKKSA